MIQILKHPRIRIQPERARDVDMVPTNLRATLRAALKWQKPWPVTIFGDTGSGKTSAALCMCDIIRTACYVTHLQLVDAIFEEDHRIWDAVATKQLVVIDDVQPPGNAVEAKAMRKALSLREKIAMAGTVVIFDAAHEMLNRFPADIQHKLRSGTTISVRQDQ